MGKKKQAPAKTIEARQNQLINLAAKEAERRLQDGTASSQIITTLLKWGSVMAELELEKARSENELLQSKKKEIDQKASGNDMFERALNAFRSYQGTQYVEEDDYDE